MAGDWSFMIMCSPEESKAAAIEDEIAELWSRAIDDAGVFSSTAHRVPTLAALTRLLASRSKR